MLLLENSNLSLLIPFSALILELSNEDVIINPIVPFPFPVLVLVIIACVFLCSLATDTDLCVVIM